jgi:hypothetical protein
MGGENAKTRTLRGAQLTLTEQTTLALALLVLLVQKDDNLDNHGGRGSADVVSEAMRREASSSRMGAAWTQRCVRVTSVVSSERVE